VTASFDIYRSTKLLIALLVNVAFALYREPFSKICPLDGCGRSAFLLVLGREYDPLNL